MIVELTSGILTSRQVQAELAATPEILRRHGLEQVVAFFGYGTTGNTDEMWESHELHVSKLLEFAQQGVERGLFVPGKTDLYVEAPDESTVLQFCHDSDIHLKSANEALIEEMSLRWKDLGFSGFRKVGKKWVPFAGLGEDIARMQERIARQPVQDERSDDEILGYDERGLPD